MRIPDSLLRLIWRLTPVKIILLIGCSCFNLSAQVYTFTTLAGVADSPASFDGFGSGARFTYPEGVAADNFGNVYVSDAYTIRKISSIGVVTTLAGVAGGFGSSDGIGGSARFWNPRGMVIDSTGNIYVADAGNSTIRKITPAGVVTTIAGLAGSIGSNDGAGSNARFKYPSSVARDSLDNIYVADSQNHTIRKITPAGTVSTFAGLAGVSGNTNGTGSVARFYYPAGVGTDGADNVYIADQSNHTIRKISPAGVVTTLAGLAGNQGYLDGTGVGARFCYPSGVSLDSAGYIYVADYANIVIRKISPAGVVTTIAGLARAQGSADGTGNGARFDYPWGIATDSADNIFVTDRWNHTIRKITPTGTVTTLAGLASGSGAVDGPIANALFAHPSGVATDASGNVFVSDTYNQTIRKISSGGVVTTLAGAAGSIGSSDGSGSNARFYYPFGIAIDSLGNVYIADTYNHTIRKITPGGVVTTFAGSANQVGSTNGTGSSARFDTPYGAATDGSNNVYIADSGNYTIRKITPSGIVTTLAGLAGNIGSADGNGNAARFNYPYGVAADNAGNVYVADTRNNTIRKITPSGDVSTLAGMAGVSGSSDGIGSSARFNNPRGIAVDPSGNFIVSDAYNKTIRKITPAGVVTTIAGSVGNYGNVDGSGTFAWFNVPQGIAIDAAGNIYVVDSNGNSVRVGKPGIVDFATIDSTNNVTGALRQLDTSPQNSTSWVWKQIRQPTFSSAGLSSTTLRNPTFTPDVADFYQFRLNATDATGRRSISTVTLDAGCPLIQAVPYSRDICAGAAVTLDVTATGNPPPSYQWSRNGSPITGATASSYAIPSTSAADAGGYTCALVNSCGGAATPNANLTVSSAVPSLVGNSQQVTKPGTNLVVNWFDISDASGYAVYRDTAASGFFPTLTGTSPSGSYGISVPMPTGSTLFFKVAGVNGCGTGPK